MVKVIEAFENPFSSNNIRIALRFRGCVKTSLQINFMTNSAIYGGEYKQNTFGL